MGGESPTRMGETSWSGGPRREKDEDPHLRSTDDVTGRNDPGPGRRDRPRRRFCHRRRDVDHSLSDCRYPIRPRIGAGARARHLAEAGDHFGANLYPRIDDLIVCVREMALDGGSRASEGRCQATTCLHVSGHVEVHQAVGGADLDFRIDVPEGLDQRVQTVLCPDPRWPSLLRHAHRGRGRKGRWRASG